MIKFWDKDFINYAQSKNYLLIPRINNLKEIIIGDKAIKNNKFDPKIFEWLKNN